MLPKVQSCSFLFNLLLLSFLKCYYSLCLEKNLGGILKLVIFQSVWCATLLASALILASSCYTSLRAVKESKLLRLDPSPVLLLQPRPELQSQLSFSRHFPSPLPLSWEPAACAPRAAFWFYRYNIYIEYRERERERERDVIDRRYRR